MGKILVSDIETIKELILEGFEASDWMRRAEITDPKYNDALELAARKILDWASSSHTDRVLEFIGTEVHTNMSGGPDGFTIPKQEVRNILKRAKKYIAKPIKPAPKFTKPF